MRNTSHADLIAFSVRSQLERSRIDALSRDHRSRMREAQRNVEKADHFRQLTAIGLFTACVCIWGFVIWRGLYGG